MLIPDEPSIIAQANQCLQQSNYLGLVNNLTHLLSLDPKNPDYHFQLAEAYSQLLKSYRLNKYCNNALNHYQQAIKLYPQNSLYYGQRAKIYLLKHQQDKALKDLNTAIELEPSNAHYYEQRAPLASALGEIKLAIDDYQRLARAKPDNMLFLQKINELQQKLGSMRLGPAAMPRSVDETKDNLAQLVTQRKRAKMSSIAWTTASALSGLVVLAGVILSSLGLLAIGLPLVALGGVLGAFTTIKAITHQLEKRCLDKQIKAESTALYRVQPQRIVHYATFSSQPLPSSTIQSKLVTTNDGLSASSIEGYKSVATIP